MKKKICKSCKRIYTQEKCPNCGGNAQARSFQGRVIVLDSENSGIAKKMNLHKNGEYAIKVR